MKVVLDTNVIIAPFLSPKGVPSLILKAWEGEAFDLVTSEALLAEYRRVLMYPDIAEYHKMNKMEIEEVIDRLRKFSIVVTPSRIPKVVKEDPDDDQLFAVALTGEAFCIVTKNKHVLTVSEYKGIQVITPLAFLKLLELI